MGYDTMAILSRKETETTPAMQAGQDFENEVMQGEHPEIVEIINGGIYQQCLFKEFQGYLLFGYADLVKDFKIYDFKATNNYEIGKYRKGTQHLIYPYCAEIDEFEYIVKCGLHIFYEPYTRDDNRLIEVIKNFENWLEFTGTRSIYEKNYKTKRIIGKIKETTL
jgi:hypothetical protein